jgi:hypothetical protein
VVSLIYDLLMQQQTSNQPLHQGKMVAEILSQWIWSSNTYVGE